MSHPRGKATRVGTAVSEPAEQAKKKLVGLAGAGK